MGVNLSSLFSSRWPLFLAETWCCPESSSPPGRISRCSLLWRAPVSSRSPLRPRWHPECSPPRLCLAPICLLLLVPSPPQLLTPESSSRPNRSEGSVCKCLFLIIPRLSSPFFSCHSCFLFIFSVTSASAILDLSVASGLLTACLALFSPACVPGRWGADT